VIAEQKNQRTQPRHPFLQDLKIPNLMNLMRAKEPYDFPKSLIRQNSEELGRVINARFVSSSGALELLRA
jgi:hypothetical protein